MSTPSDPNHPDQPPRLEPGNERNIFPSHWMITELKNLCIKIQDGNYGADYPKNDEWVDKGIPFITGAALGDKYIEFNKLKYISVEKHLLLKKAQTTAGDIVFPNRGATDNQRLGKSPIAYLLGHEYEVSNINPQLTLLRPEKEINSRYLKQAICSPFFLSQFRELTKGSALAFINLTKTKNILIPIAPLAEQKQIADRLDALLAQVDTLKNRLDAIPAILKRFRQSVLAAAVSGKLTEEWRGINNPKKVESRLIKQEHENIFKTKGINNYVQPEPILESSHPYEINDLWVWMRSEELCDVITKGTTPTKNQVVVDGTIPFIKVYNLTFDGSLDFSVEPTFISKDIHENVLKRSKVIPGDVLMNIVGPPLGKVSIVPNTYPEWNINQAICVFRPICGVINRYFSLCLMDYTLLSLCVSKAKATAGQFNLTLLICRDFAIPVPPLEEQTEIVRRVDQLFAFADQIEQRVAEAKKRVDHLTQSILAKAFRGDLTAEWRAENPDLITGENSAEALLERIRAERAAASASTPKKPGKRRSAN